MTEPSLPEIVELDERESDWTFWPGTSNADTAGLCTCGHDGLGPDWHIQPCPAVLYLWQQRAKELHDALWGLWEDLRAGKTIDMTRPEDGPMRGHHQ